MLYLFNRLSLIVMKSLRLLSLVLVINILFTHCNNISESSPASGFIQVNGARLYYKAIGKGEPVLVVHGGPGLGHNYLLPYFEELAKSYRVIFYDQRHSGRSSSSEVVSNIAMESMVEDIEEMRKAFKIEKLNLLSHSFGSLFTIQYASQFPDHIKSLTILEPFPVSSELGYKMFSNIINKAPNEEVKKFNEVKASVEFKRSEAEAVRQFLFYYYSQFYSNPESRRIQDFSYFDEEFAQKYTTTNQFININNFSYSLVDRLERIECPTLVIYGDRDVVPIENKNIIEQSIRRCKSVMIPKSGHFGYLENSGPYFKAVKAFLKNPDKYVK
jgi:proline iminopeptidase